MTSGEISASTLREAAELVEGVARDARGHRV
jgi:hypothetical protein